MFLQRAIDLAVAAHRDAEDPPGEPYILHPMRVMLRFPATQPLLQAVAILHDTMERAGLTAEDLREARLPHAVIKAVVRLTHEKGTPYADYVVRLAKNPLARAVKMADLADNADLRHVDFPHKKPRKGTRRVVRYVLSHQFLTGRLSEHDYRRLMKEAEN
ncbi:MAG TPA: hypothetical protein VF595_08785 [Tepidisphaeraceae bacterium]